MMKMKMAAWVIAVMMGSTAAAHAADEPVVLIDQSAHTVTDVTEGLVWIRAGLAEGQALGFRQATVDEAAALLGHHMASQYPWHSEYHVPGTVALDLFLMDVNGDEWGSLLSLAFGCTPSDAGCAATGQLASPEGAQSLTIEHSPRPRDIVSDYTDVDYRWSLGQAQPGGSSYFMVRAVPEPGSIPLAVAGTGLLVAVRRRRSGR